jgi:hypothetical protein
MKTKGLKHLGDVDYSFTQNGLACAYKHAANAAGGYPSITFRSPRGAAVRLWLEADMLGVMINGVSMGYVSDTAKLWTPELIPVVEAGLAAWRLEIEHQVSTQAQARAAALKSL